MFDTHEYTSIWLHKRLLIAEAGRFNFFTYLDLEIAESCKRGDTDYSFIGRFDPSTFTPSCEEINTRYTGLATAEFQFGKLRIHFKPTAVVA